MQSGPDQQTSESPLAADGAADQAATDDPDTQTPPERLVIEIEGSAYRIGEDLVDLAELEVRLFRYREHWSNPVRVRVNKDSRAAAMDNLESLLDTLQITGIWELPPPSPPATETEAGSEPGADNDPSDSQSSGSSTSSSDG